MIAKGLNQPAQGHASGWVEDALEPEDAPQAAPVGFVETLPVDFPVDPKDRPPRTWKKRSPRTDRVKIGRASERVNRRTKG